MRYLSDIGNKQGSKKTILLLLAIFTATSVHPTPALAFELPFTSVGSQDLWNTNATVATTDPDLFKAITTMPSEPHNTYAVNAWAPAGNSPITTPGKWPAKKADWQPVTAQFNATSDPNVVAVAPNSPVKLVLEGTASYYSRAGCLGCDSQMIMANGQRLDDSRATMAIGAHLKQYVGYNARVTSLATGKSIVVPITDTGGFYQAKYGHRVADLSVATKEAIGMKGGLGPVRVEVL